MARSGGCSIGVKKNQACGEGAAGRYRCEQGGALDSLTAGGAVRTPEGRAQRHAALRGPASTCSPRAHGCGESAAPTQGTPGEVGLLGESWVFTVTAVEAQWTEDFVPSKRKTPKGAVG